MPRDTAAASSSRPLCRATTRSTWRCP
ncbi:hypothetical protein ACHAWF_010878 [Thalassiosira exigua]